MAGADCRSQLHGMTPNYDFAIFGGNALAALLAGLLAHDHGRQVLLVADPVSPQRLPRSLDLALPLATRPESWRLLERTVAETRALLASIDAGNVLDRVNVGIVADLTATQDGVAHLAGVASGYGLVPHKGLFRNVPRLGGPIGLTGSKVSLLERDAVRLSFTRAGAAELTVSGEPAGIGQIVVADDAALLELLPEGQRPPLLAAQAMIATLTTPAKRLAAPVMLYPDRGVTLVQRPDLSILGLVSGDADVEARLASALPGPFPLRRLASSRFRRVVTADGAPLIGRIKPSKLLLLAGLGNAGAFLAPTIARHLAGVSADDEKAWFAAHDPARQSRAPVAEIVAGAA